MSNIFFYCSFSVIVPPVSIIVLPPFLSKVPLTMVYVFCVGGGGVDVTVIVLVPVFTPPLPVPEEVIFAVPTAIPVTNPDALTVTIAEFEVFHVRAGHVIVLLV